MRLHSILPALVLVTGAWLAAPALAQDAPKDRKAAQAAAQNSPALQRSQRAASGPLEIQRDRYIAVPPSQRQISPAPLVSRDGYVSVQANVDANGNNIVGDAANEPSIAVDPTNGMRMVIGWRQFDSIQSDFRQAGWGYSSDGGRTWTFPGVIQPGVFRSDPVLDSDAEGNFYYNSLTTATGDYTCDVYKSTNGGATWGPGADAFGGDKQWMTIDKTDGIGHGNIYASWNASFTSCGNGGEFTRSYNGGQSFLDCLSLPGHPYWGTLAVGPDGELYISGDGFTVTKSSTIQDQNHAVQWDFTHTVNLGGSMIGWGGPNPGGLGGQVWIAVDHSDGPTRGYVYMLCSVDPASADPADIMFSRSTNGGSTWSSPIRVNDDPTNDGAWQWFGTMSVAPNGRIDAVWNDTRHDPGGYDSELYYSYSLDAGVSWASNVALSPPFDPQIGWPQQNKIGDYYTMVSDNMGADIAYSATFNGEEDVYYLRVGTRCSDAGTIALDRPAYACTDVVGIKVIDCGLNTDDNVVETVVVSIASTSEPAGEQVTLTETAPASAEFVGSIPVSTTNAPGVLLVAPGDAVTATYVDADDGQGQQVNVTATGAIDCTPPTISNVHTTNLEPRSVTIAFDCDEPALGTVHYGPDCDHLTLVAAGSDYSTSPTVDLTGLLDNHIYYYRVDAVDAVGNLREDINCYVFATPEIPDFFTELFTNNNDLDNTTITFTPNGSVDFYAGCIQPIVLLPTDPAGGTTLSLSNDSYAAVALSGGAHVYLYGVSYSTLYVGSNGYVTFTAGDNMPTESLVNHFDLPRISALFDDLNPAAGGSVSWRQLADRVAVTWLSVPEYGTSDQNTFQIEMFFDGKTTLSYLAIATADGLAGLSEGQGVSPYFAMSNLSALGSCGPRPPLASNITVQTAVNAPVTVALLGNDDGLPNPPGVLTFFIASLPPHGSLADPQAGPITTVPYSLAGHGSEVVYTPGPYYSGADNFQYLANDGGVPPEGGDSNVAMVSISVLAGAAQRVFQFNMNSDPGWTAEGQWAYGHPAGGGSHSRDPSNGYTGANVYGYNLNGDYPNNMTTTLYLTTHAMNFRYLTNVELRFARWLGVEGSQFDHANLQVSTDGANWTDLWANSTAIISESAWSQQVYNLSGVADGQGQVYLRWGMGPTDNRTTYPGWNIDDVEIWGVVHVAAGDMNCDGSVNNFDITPFVLALTDPAAYAAAYPGCSLLNGDVNADAAVNNFDITPFVQLLTGP